MELLGLQRARIAQDGRAVRAVFETDQGSLETDVNVAALEVVVASLIQTLTDARHIREPTTLTQTFEPSHARATATKARQSVVMDFRLHNGFEHHFDLPVSMAHQLQVQLAGALADCARK
jgi:hypothetical protein